MKRIEGMSSWDKTQGSANGSDPHTKVFLLLSYTGLNNPDNQIADQGPAVHSLIKLILD